MANQVQEILIIFTDESDSDCDNEDGVVVNMEVVVIQIRFTQVDKKL